MSTNQFYQIDNLIPTLHQRDRIRGSNDAPIVLVEYGDYACLRSGKLYFSIEQLQAQLGDRLLFVFRHFPQIHLNPQSQKAAETAEAAAAQNRFWQMHNLLCQHPQALTDADLVEYAVQLNLDIPRLLSELAERVHQERVQSDIDSGQQLGVKHAPMCFMGIRCQTDRDLKDSLQVILTALSNLEI
jgi:protein-disulfide isomerase